MGQQGVKPRRRVEGAGTEVLNVYAPPDAPPDDYSQYMFDVIWGSNAAELIEFGVHLSPKLKEDLVGDTKAFVLIVNQMDTLTRIDSQGLQIGASSM